MPPALLRVALVACVSIGVAAGCASGTKGRESSPSPNQTVTRADLDQRPGQPIEKVLQDKVPGLLVTRTADGGIALQLRGPSTLNGSGEPLYVIDGQTMQPGAGGALTGINPYDIDSIKVLKDPADTSVYGVGGGNGVILITTERPGKR
jgi:TonB-dependent SusC/RagA subfamily outer membrane receptor